MGISDTLKHPLTIPLLQTGLTIAGWITQLAVGGIPGRTPVSELSKKFCERTKFITDISEGDKKLIENFKSGIILANHPNKIMADFPAWLQYLVNPNIWKLRIWTWLSVTPMYGKLLTNTESFLAELRSDRRQDLAEINKWIEESINFVSSKRWVLILPYFEDLWAVHRKILNWVSDHISVIEIESQFPEIIWYKEMYKRILWTPNPLDIRVSVQEKTVDQLSNR